MLVCTPHSPDQVVDMLDSSESLSDGFLDTLVLARRSLVGTWVDCGLILLLGRMEMPAVLRGEDGEVEAGAVLGTTSSPTGSVRAADFLVSVACSVPESNVSLEYESFPLLTMVSSLESCVLKIQ